MLVTQDKYEQYGNCPTSRTKISQDDCESTWVLKTTLERVTRQLTKNHIQGSTKSRVIDDRTTNENQP